MADDPPIAAVLTPRGRGAVATVAFAGDVQTIDAAGLFAAANGRRIAEQSLGRTVFGRWGREPSEEIVLCRVAAERVEIHGHGGEAAVERILADLEGVGAERIGWFGFVERTDGPFAADVAAALAAATTTRTAALIAQQADGPLRHALERLAAADPLGDRGTILESLHALLRWAVFGEHLARPWGVVLFGRPNAGKSSLVNALAGFERSIVFDRPGTTRDVVTAETAFDGWPVRLSDTAGLRSDADALEAAGIGRARAAASAADLRVLVLDRSRPPEDEDARTADELVPSLIVLNKADLPDAWGDRRPAGAIEVSAKTGGGIRELSARLSATLVPCVPADDEAVPVTPRQIESLRAARHALLNGDDVGFRNALSRIAPTGR